jgi:hypothetical protein
MSLQLHQHYPWVANPWRSDSLSKVLKLQPIDQPWPFLPIGAERTAEDQ